MVYHGYKAKSNISISIYCYNCTKAIFIVFVNHLYILFNNTTVFETQIVQKLNHG